MDGGNSQEANRILQRFPSGSSSLSDQFLSPRQQLMMEGDFDRADVGAGPTQAAGVGKALVAFGIAVRETDTEPIGPGTVAR